MPIFEYKCKQCGHIQEMLLSTSEAKEIGYMKCDKCGMVAKKIISMPHFRVTGFNAKNGYCSIPTYDEVIDENGYAKKRWGK